MTARITAIALALLIAAGGIYLLAVDGEPPASRLLDDSLAVAPDFELERLDGGSFRLSEQRGQVVVLNIWATWCTPCREEVPDLVSIQEVMREDVVVVGVSVDEGDPAAVRSFAEAFDVNYPMVIDDGSVTDSYGPIGGIPTTYLVDRSGRLQLKASGMLTIDQLTPVLERLIAGEVIDEAVPPFQRIRKGRADR